MPAELPVAAVTVDGFGTLLRLDDPVSQLVAALARHGVVAPVEDVGQAFRAEVEYYRPRSHQASDTAGLAELRRECVEIFLRQLDIAIEPDTFVLSFMGALQFQLISGVASALERLREQGLRLACVANWDIGLHDELARLDIHRLFDVVVTSADVGAPKPDPAIFRHALSALGVSAAETIHIGDEDVDSDGARAVGMRFEPIPLSTLPERIAAAA